jgi:hypothetical protein
MIKQWRNKMSFRKWTKAARELLFEELVKRFGKHSEWEFHTKPGHGLDRSFDNFCKTMSDVVGADGPDAVKIQIAFGLPITGKSTWKQGHAGTAILCLAAAIEAGFISSTDVPTLVATPNSSTTVDDHASRRAQTEAEARL